MICNLIRVLAYSLLFVFCYARCDAAVIWEFDLKNLGPFNTGGTFGTSISQPKALADGANSFTATLVVTGSTNIGYLATANGGIGVNGNTMNGSNGSESLRFTMLVSPASGVSVTFNGFTDLGLSTFGGSDLAVLSTDNNYLTISDNFTVDSTGTLTSTPVPGTPSAFTVFSVLDTQAFLVSSVTASFTATAAAVPEPSIFGTLVIGTLFTPLFRRFRRRRNSVDSKSLIA